MNRLSHWDGRRADLDSHERDRDTSPPEHYYRARRTPILRMFTPNPRSCRSRSAAEVVTQAMTDDQPKIGKLVGCDTGVRAPRIIAGRFASTCSRGLRPAPLERSARGIWRGPRRVVVLSFTSPGRAAAPPRGLHAQHPTRTIRRSSVETRPSGASVPQSLSRRLRSDWRWPARPSHPLVETY